MMNQRIFLNVAGTAAVLFVGASLPSLAQNPGRGGGGGFGGPGGPMAGLMNPQMTEMITKMRQSHAFADPGISNTANLLTRPDVRNELVLNGRQTEALTDLQNGYPMAMGQQMMTTMQAAFQKMRDAGGGNIDFRTMSPEDRQQMRQQMQDQAQEAMATVQGDQDKKAEALLTPAQIKRLHELDLQWRGPLALSEIKLGEKVALTPEQRAKFAAMLKEFRDARQQAQASLWGGGAGANGRPRGQGNAPGSTPGAGATNSNGGTSAPADNTTAGGQPSAGGPPNGGFGGRGFTMPTPEQMQQSTEEANKKIDALRKITDKKALTLLTPEQQQQWKTLQGRTFLFRTNL